MLTNAILCSLSILFVYTVFQDEYILGRLCTPAKWLGELYKPLVGCMVCMTPYYGLVYSAIFLHYGLKDFIQFVFVVGGLNCLIGAIVGFLNDIPFIDGK